MKYKIKKLLLLIIVPLLLVGYMGYVDSHSNIKHEVAYKVIDDLDGFGEIRTEQAVDGLIESNQFVMKNDILKKNIASYIVVLYCILAMGYMFLGEHVKTRANIESTQDYMMRRDMKK